MTSLTPILPAAGEAQLIPAFHGVIGGMPMQVCKAKDLHAFLEVGRDFPTWFSDRVAKYGFVQDQDFALIPQNGGIKNGRGGDRRSKGYLTSLDMAKELSMVENNAKGREARRYFIALERQVLGMGPAPVKPRQAKRQSSAFDALFGDAFGASDTHMASASENETIAVTMTKDDYIAFLEGKVGCFRATPPSASAPGPFSPRTEGVGERRAWRRVTKEEEAEILERYTAGESKASIARSLGRHHGVVDRAIAAVNSDIDRQGDLFPDASS